jgi:diguanylate cyclase (GGDEF)-like protein/PAS domain S-box-containing protein
VERRNRLVVAGDSTVLIVDDDLVDPTPLGKLVAAEDPLRLAAEAALAGDSGTIDSDLVMRIILGPMGGVAAVEVQRTGSDATALMMGGWRYPDSPAELHWSPELQTLHGTTESGRPKDITEFAGAILLPGYPAFSSGVHELFAASRALRDLRISRRDDRSIRTLRLYGWLGEEEGQALGVTIDVSDIALAPDETTAFFESAIAAVPDTLLVVDISNGEMLWANTGLTDRLGYPLRNVGDFSAFRDALAPEDRDALDVLIADIRKSPRDVELIREDLRLRIRDAGSRWRWIHLWLAPWTRAPDGTVQRVVCTVRDVDDAVRAEQRLLWEAGHDPLTGLANRRVINDTVQRAAEHTGNPRRHLYFINLDDFKKVNDALGHSAGDDLLRTFATRLSVLVNPNDVVGRFGGDELVIVSAVKPDRLADRLLSATRRPATVAGSEITVSSSIGVAEIGPGEDPGDVIRRANEAMYEAKRAGRNRYAIAGPLNIAPAQRRVELEAELRHAMADDTGELQMVFQPIVNRDRVPVAAEALLRWQHPTRGQLLPTQFLPIAESAGLMTELGELIIRQSIAAVARWTAAGRPLLVTVNVGSRQLGEGRVTSVISQLLTETAIRPRQICMEVTESVLVDADSPELAELWQLREMGLEIALDDFGTGYAPLTYLKRLPATILKLDKSFVAGLDVTSPNPIDSAVARAVAQIADDIGMRVIAEGVESERQVHALSEMGYRLFQGFWAHPPLSAEDLDALLAGR